MRVGFDVDDYECEYCDGFVEVDVQYGVVVDGGGEFVVEWVYQQFGECIWYQDLQ